MKIAFNVLLLFLLYYLILKISFKRDSLKREKEIDSYIEQWRLLYILIVITEIITEVELNKLKIIFKKVIINLIAFFLL